MSRGATLSIDCTRVLHVLSQCDKEIDRHASTDEHSRIIIPDAWTCVRLAASAKRRAGADGRPCPSARAGRINGCVRCIDMHARDSRQTDETDERLFEIFISTLTINNNLDRQATFADNGIADKNNVLHLGGSTSDPRLSDAEEFSLHPLDDVCNLSP